MSSTDDRLQPAAAIWREHFHLAGDPFSLTPDPGLLYLSPAHAEALAGLRLSLLERRGLTVLVGGVGTGKTTILYSLLSGLDDSVETAYVANTSLSFDEVLASVLRDLGVEPSGTGRLGLLDALNDVLRRAAETGATVALVVDEAQNLPDSAFEQLRLLLNFETYESKLLQIVLAGQPELGGRLRAPGLRQVADRVALCCRLGPLSRAETGAYLRHRLEAVGGSARCFSRAARNLVVRKSRGIPRRVNVLCHNAMLAAYGRGREQVDRAAAAEAVRDMAALRGFPLLPWLRRRVRQAGG